jgi:hypothetical protein
MKIAQQISDDAPAVVQVVDPNCVVREAHSPAGALFCEWQPSAPALAATLDSLKDSMCLLIHKHSVHILTGGYAKQSLMHMRETFSKELRNPWNVPVQLLQVQVCC